MKVKVVFYGVLKTLSNTESLELEFSQDSVKLKDLVHKIVEIIDGAEFSERFLDKETLFVKPDIIVLVNDRDIGLLAEEETVIKDNTVVVFIPSTHGG